MMKPIRFAILGAGNIGRTHAEAIDLAEGAELAAVWNRNLERAKALAGEWKAEASDELEAVLAREDIDAVTVATPSGAHLDVVGPAAKAGKHVLCEKPLEVTGERAQQIIDTCRDAGVELACIFQARLNRNVQRIRDALDAGRFGPIVLASMQLRWFRDRDYYADGSWRGTWALDGGGALMNQGIHFVDLLCYLGGAVSEVHGWTTRRVHEGIEVEDTAAATVRFADGGLGTIEASTACAPGFPRRLEISGANGTAVLEDDRLVTWRFTQETDADEAIRNEGLEDEGMRGGASNPQIGCEGHRRLVEDLVAAIREGRPPAIPGHEGVRAVRLIESIYQAARTGEPVHLGEQATTGATP